MGAKVRRGLRIIKAEGLSKKFLLKVCTVAFDEVAK